MQRFTTYDSDPRKLPAHLRTHAVMDLLHFFQPLSIHLRLEGMVSRTIRDSYLARNPFDPTYRGNLRERLESFKSGKDLAIRFEPTASGFSIVGMSGVGKTTGMKRVLSLYPQIILHNRYQGRNFTAVQLVWLRLECPKDGSITALCIDFFKSVDDLIGTNYSERYGVKGRNTQELMLFMAIVAAEHHLGFLVIDEIQDLSTAKSGGAAQVLNFFVKLINIIGIPVVLIGTYKAIPIMCSEFRLARRGSGQGDLVWDRMSYGEEDEEWNVFVEALWELQYVKKTSSLTPQLSEVLYDISYGITDLAIRIYMASQIRAIETGREEVTADLLRSAYRDDFRLVNNILEALKSGNITPLHNLSDIYPPAIQTIHSLAPGDGKCDEARGNSLTVNRAMSGDGAKNNQKSQTPPRRASGRDSIGVTGLCTIKRTNKSETVIEEGDLRSVITQARKIDSTASAYDALLKAGYIKSAMEYVPEVVKS